MRWDTKAAASAFFTSCVVLLFGLTWGLAGEVIEPTRTLQDPGKTWGGLTVFSEPPQLDVYLDGEKAGKTPLWLREVQTGSHTLKIGSAETSVRVEEGKRLKIGLFKGNLVTSSESQREKPKPERQLKQPATVPESQGQEERENLEDLSLWEKFVNGSLKHF
jgi:PEGA domain